MAWNRDACLGSSCKKKKQGQTNFFEIHLTLLHIFYVLFHSDTWMSLGGTRTFVFSSHQESPSCPPENRPSGTRKNQASFPFHSGNPTTFSSIFNFQFSDSMTSASVSASKPLLPSSLHILLSKPYKPSLFLTFPVVFRIGEE